MQTIQKSMHAQKKKSPYRVQDLHGKGKENEISFPEER